MTHHVRLPRRSARRHALLAAAAAVAAAATVAAVGAAGPAVAASAPCSGSSHPAADTEAAAINALGARLQQALAGDGSTTNVVISPLSIEAALAMASAGASGDTLTQMNDVLGLRPDSHASLGALLDAVVTGGDGSLELANSLWAQAGLTTQPAFLDVLRADYSSELYDADFRVDPGGARDEINAWVADATHDRITELLSPQAVTAMTRFVLVNAVYLDADWASPFEPDNTRPESFTTGAGESMDVETMHQTLFAEYAASDGLQAITLPYTAGYEMVVVLPGDGGLVDFEQQLVDAGGDLDTVVGGWSDSEVRLALPTWDTETSSGLSAQLQHLGIADAFDPSLADFSGITTDEPIFIGDVIHEANITVDEAGTEAAAATAVIAPAGAAPGTEPEPVEMTVDRPFFFAVRDVESGATLFQGRVVDPS
jgi:serpin B